MKKYIVLLKLYYQIRLEYRGDMIVYSLGTVATPLISLALWLSASSYNSLSYSTIELITYFITVAYIVVLTEMWQSWFMSEDIKNGHFSTMLLKPILIFPRYCVENLSDKFYKILVITLGGLLICLLKSINIFDYFQTNFLSLFLFFCSILLGYLIFFLIELSIGLSAVWFSDIDFMKNILALANSFLSGRFAPITFYPPFLSSIIIFLPFRYAASFPADLLLNKLSNYQILSGFTIAIFWLVVAIIAYKVLLSNFKKSYQGYGA